MYGIVGLIRCFLDKELSFHISRLDKEKPKIFLIHYAFSSLQNAVLPMYNFLSLAYMFWIQAMI